jgi:flagellar basal body-associated protein FliL
MMADDKDTKKKAKKASRNKLIMALVIGMVIVLSGAAVYLFLMSKKPATLDAIALPPEIVLFSFERLPDAYGMLVTLDEEIRRTEAEIARISAVGETYPDQKKIADAESKAWTANLSALSKIRTEFEKQIEMMYVSVQVNPETGQALIDEKKDEILKKTEAVIVQSKTMTDKLRAIDEARSFFEKTRDRFKK